MFYLIDHRARAAAQAVHRWTGLPHHGRRTEGALREVGQHRGRGGDEGSEDQAFARLWVHHLLAVLHDRQCPECAPAQNRWTHRRTETGCSPPGNRCPECGCHRQETVRWWTARRSRWGVPAGILQGTVNSISRSYGRLKSIYFVGLWSDRGREHCFWQGYG